MNINNGANVGITASESIVLKEGVKVNEGAFLSLIIDNDFSSSCGNNKYSTPINQSNNNKTNETKNNKLDDSFKIISRSKHTDFNMINNLIVFPNPSDGKFTLNSYNIVKSIYVYNSMGELILKKNNINKNSVIFDISKYTNGLYYLKVFTGQKIKTYKIVKF